MSKPLTADQRKKANAASLRYYYSHKEKVAARNAAWWKAHPEQRREKDRRRSVRKSEWRKTYRKLYRSKNREKLNAASRAWQKTEAGRIAIMRHNHVRRARKLGVNSDSRGIAQWMREIRSHSFARCHWCGTKVFGRKVHFDHVVALSVGGTHTIGNLCVSCPECNFTKNNRLIADWIAGGQTFLNL